MQYKNNVKHENAKEIRVFYVIIIKCILDFFYYALLIILKQLKFLKIFLLHNCK